MNFPHGRILLCTLILIAPVARSQSVPLAPGTQVVTITDKPGYFNEPSIAVNPRNPRQLVAAFQVNATPAYSEDQGHTWTTLPEVAPRNFKISGDVSVAYDAHGHAILCYIAFDKLGTINYWGHNATRNGIFIKRSLDGGKTWEPDAIPVMEHATSPNIPFEDKPYIVADTTDGPHSGNLYIGWTEFSLTKSIILFSRSTDGGKTWSAPTEISSHEGLPRDDNGSVEGFTGAVAPDGTLYVVWADGNSIAATRSRDGGRSFDRSRKIIDTAPPYFDVTDVSRSNGFPQIGLDPRGDHQGSLLYLTWSDYRNGDVDVFCSTSRNHGRTWSAPVRVNSSPIHDGTDQFFQWLAVDPQTGGANVLFYDRRADPGNLKTTVTLARSEDAGRSFTNYAWTIDPFESHQDFIGDYTGIAAFQDRVYGIWTEERPPASPPKPSANPSEEGSAAGRHSTVVRVGIADFSANRNKQ